MDLELLLVLQQNARRVNPTLLINTQRMIIVHVKIMQIIIIQIVITINTIMLKY